MAVTMVKVNGKWTTMGAIRARGAKPTTTTAKPTTTTTRPTTTTTIQRDPPDRGYKPEPKLIERKPSTTTTSKKSTRATTAKLNWLEKKRKEVQDRFKTD